MARGGRFPDLFVLPHLIRLQLLGEAKDHASHVVMQQAKRGDVLVDVVAGVTVDVT